MTKDSRRIPLQETQGLLKRVRGLLRKSRGERGRPYRAAFEREKQARGYAVSTDRLGPPPGDDAAWGVPPATRRDSSGVDDPDLVRDAVDAVHAGYVVGRVALELVADVALEGD